MAVKLTEAVPNQGLTRATVCTVEKYGRHSIRRAWSPFGGVIYTASEGGKLEVYSDNGRNAYWYLRLVNQLKGRGFQISRGLQILASKDAKEKADAAARAQEHYHRCHHRAATENRPVVVTSSNYQTTASVGTNYRLVLPSGESIAVQNGCPTGSHSLKGGTTHSDSAIQDAIARFNRQD
jgi:hypothetical protein